MTAAVAADSLSSRKPEKPAETNVKETIESILVAFILAFIFRCFVIEAFVIPTGSMAPTLLGAHMQMRCPDCGYRFTVGSAEQTDSNYSIKANSDLVFSLFCPNCAYRFPRKSEADPENDASQPPLRYGDRILVMKYVYLLHEPSRWDVVVFKTPDPPTPGDYSVNYIKRLTGLPGESLMVAEGDLYVAPAGADPEKLESYKIQTKPVPAQEALWRIVYDADYLPTGQPRNYKNNNGIEFSDPAWQQPWKQTLGEGWHNASPEHDASGRQFAFDNASGRGELSFSRETNPHNSALTDWLAYDQSYRPDRGLGSDMFGLPGYGLINNGRYVSPVSDLKLSCLVDRLEGDGTLRLMLTKGEDQFTAELSKTQVRLIRNTRDTATVLGTAPLDARLPLRVAFENVDHRVTLRINERDVLVSTPEQYPPDLVAILARVNNDMPPPHGNVQIQADRLKTRLSHLQLWRDVYYLDRDPIRNRDASRATGRAFPNNVVRLNPREYFVMGDNSYQSEDARYWDNGVDLPNESLSVKEGRVPDRFMLGKAFFVYWPAGYRPTGGLPPLGPNFGEMRLIR